jgi:hypothetical protein
VVGAAIDASRRSSPIVHRRFRVDGDVPVSRRYLDEGLVLETTFRGPAARRGCWTASPSCRRCQRTWTATYQVGTFTDDAGDHEVYFREGASATAPGSTRCPHCGGLRVVVLPSRAE